MAEKVTKKEITHAHISTFTDTDEMNILKAYSAGIVNGVSKTEFAPNDYITREQIATMLYRAIAYVEKEKGKEYTTKIDSIEGYKDQGDVSNWAKQGVGILLTSANVGCRGSSCTIKIMNKILQR